MAILRASEMIAEVRTLVLDNPSVTANRAFTDAQHLGFINEAYLRWFEGIEPRVTWMNQLLGLAAGASPIATNSYSVTTSDSNIAEVLEVALATSASASFGPLLEKEELNNVLGLVASNPTAGTIQKWSAMRAASSISSNIGAWTLYFWPPASAGQYLSFLCRKYPALLDITTTTTKSVDTHNGTNVLDGITSTNGLYVGMPVSGTGIGSGALITDITSGTAIKVSVVSSASATVTATFTADTTPDVPETSAYTICRLAAARVARLIGRDDAFIADIMSPVPTDMQQSMNVSVKSYNLPRPRPDEKPV